ncbi:dUTPase-like protein [Paenibacillus sp. BK033]|uniref:dUTPase n=1 Tax=Paenibacillus sp. BK033 TaxID=2512133 RepID=UPI00105262B6|nr:dUTPase [Paenibacillus sp. BK033]TCM89630.1 dUTPase-like protein [Paenibacillus sp. BK033]
MYDRLTQLFTMQKALDERITQERTIEKTTDEWVIGITLAMESEIDEIRREVNWKWWKNPKRINTPALQEEIIDMWHFLISLSDKVGLTADDVYEIYTRKNSENHARQDGTSTKDGYEVIA